MWPGHAAHAFTNDYESFGQLEDASFWATFRDAKSVDAAWQLLLRHRPRDAFHNGATLLKSKHTQLAMERKKCKAPSRTLASFNLPPLDLSKSVLLCGASNIGKTSFCMAHGNNPYFMKTLDQLKDIPGDCDLLIFDDMRFDTNGLDMTPEEMIALLDTEYETAIKCRHYDGIIPALPRIFTSNLDHAKGRTVVFPRDGNDEQQEGIDRRFHYAKDHNGEPITYLTEKLYDGAGVAPPPARPRAPVVRMVGAAMALVFMLFMPILLRIKGASSLRETVTESTL